MKLIEQVYGLITSGIDKNQRHLLFNSIEPAWNKTTFEKNLYSILENLISNDQETNGLTITARARELGLFNHKFLLYYSGMASKLPSDALLTIGQTLGQIDYQASLERAQRAVKLLNDMTSGENYTESKFLDMMSEASEGLMKKEIDIIDNVELISQVMIRHDAVKRGESFGLSLPFTTLQDGIALEPIDMMVIGARPAMGKTAFAVSVVVGLAKQSKNVALFALEMSAEQMMRRILGCIAGVDTLKIKNGTLNDTEERAIYQAQDNPLLKFIVIYEGSHSIRQITNRVNELKLTRGLDVFIVDYLQKIVSTKSSGSRYEQVTENSNKLKLISQNLKVPSIALAQIGRESAKVGRLPGLTDLRDSGEIEQDASVIAFLHRPEYYGEEQTSEGNDAAGKCEFLIAKNREGVIDTFELDISLECSRFSDINTYEKWKSNDITKLVDYTDNSFNNK